MTMKFVETASCYDNEATVLSKREAAHWELLTEAG